VNCSGVPQVFANDGGIAPTRHYLNTMLPLVIGISNNLFGAVRTGVAGAQRCRHAARRALRATPSSRGQTMSTEDDREKRREESPEWHRARAKSLREHGFTKMAEEHEQIAQAIECRRQQEQTK
jgi:hypothetical protein